MNRLSVLLQPRQVVLDVEVTNKAALLDYIGQWAQAFSGVEADRISRSLQLREKVGSTGLGKGFAIPHARLVELDHTVVMYMQLASAIDFDAIDHKPVTDVLVLLVPQPACQVHLDLLAEATYLFGLDEFRYWLRQCRQPDAIVQLIESYELPVDLTLLSQCDPRHS